MADDANNGGEPTTGAKYTDDDLNRLIAKERHKWQKQLDSTNQAFKEMQGQVEALLQGKPIDDVRAEMEETAVKLRTAEDNARIAKEQADNRVKAAEEKEQTAWRKYQDSVIGRALTDAAIGKASSPAAAKLLAKELRERAKLGDDDSVSVEMELVEDGVKVKRFVSPEVAINELEKQTDYAPYFKATVAGGAGGQASNKPIDPGDISNMSMEEYKQRREQPGFLDQFREVRAGQ